jgi:succinate-semialdehyde dehydrogenase / glutarate-semialdehyde dehydrogenase
MREACLIAGQWTNAADRIAIDNPATCAVIGHVPAFGAEMAERAIAAAADALSAWSTTSAKHRADILKRYYALIVEHRDSLAELMTLEQGKPLAEARAEISYAASFIEWFAEEARRVYGELIPANSENTRLMVMRQPIGVVAAITPWNFPAAMVTRKIGPALAAGCTVVLKPAEQTPFTALALGALAEQAGVPAGVLNIVTGDATAIGPVLTRSPLVRKLSFTGSTRVGALLYEQSAPTIKKLSLELGGNAPFIVFDDADLARAAEGVIASKFRNAGQTCVCANRILVQAAIHDRFVSHLTDLTRSLKVGDGFDQGVDIGPLIDAAAVEKMELHIADALAEGARLIIGGKRHELGGRFFEPTLVTGVRPGMLVTREETFGPLAPIVRFDHEEDAIAIANATPFGLAAYAYTSNLARSWRLAERIESGMVGINTGVISTEVAPFGGIKQSGLGREGGRQGIDDYLETKYVALALECAKGDAAL